MSIRLIVVGKDIYTLVGRDEAGKEWFLGTYTSSGNNDTLNGLRRDS